ncbi:uncharacterized protein METZ01_LOCUS248406 [marine metagenome]|uniref:Uncharacterized protein n=1 Tax=marine metagenome TaxID=408172 RepID=A0A382I8C5_9ZZZZ
MTNRSPNDLDELELVVVNNEKKGMN